MSRPVLDEPCFAPAARVASVLPAQFRRVEKGVMGIGWQLLEGVMALLASVALTWWIFVAPSRAKRERRRVAREMKDPRLP